MPGVRFVKEIRDSLGLKHYGLAARLGVTTSAIYNVENRNGRRMDLGTLVKLRKIAGLSWSAFGKLLDAEFLERKEGD